MKQLLKFLVLSQTQKFLLVKTIFLLLIVRLGLWILPFYVIQNFLAKLKRTINDLNRIALADQIIWSVEAASNYLPLTKSCLVKSIVGQILLAQYGCKSNLCIGVRRNEKILDAHAWLEIEGEVVIGKTNLITDYVKLPSLQEAKS